MDLIRRHEGGIALDRAAYLAREDLTCPVTGEHYDWSSNDDLVEQKLIGTSLSRTKLWTAVELAERRFKAVIARSIKVALPRENTPEKNWELMLRFAQFLSDRLGTVVDFSYHHPRRETGKENPHGHIQIPTRIWDEIAQEFGAKTREFDQIKTGGPLMREIRQTWENLVNQSLPEGVKPVCCKSHADLGDGLIPRKHLGRVATEMEQNGYSTNAGEYNRQVDQYNEAEREIQRLEKALAALSREAPTVVDTTVTVNAATVAEVITIPIEPTQPPSVTTATKFEPDKDLSHHSLLPRTLEEELGETIAASAFGPGETGRHEAQLSEVTQMDPDSPQVANRTPTSSGTEEVSTPSRPLSLPGSDGVSLPKFDENVPLNLLEPPSLEGDLVEAGAALEALAAMPPTAPAAVETTATVTTAPVAEVCEATTVEPDQATSVPMAPKPKHDEEPTLQSLRQRTLEEELAEVGVAAPSVTMGISQFKAQLTEIAILDPDSPQLADNTSASPGANAKPAYSIPSEFLSHAAAVSVSESEDGVSLNPLLSQLTEGDLVETVAVIEPLNPRPLEDELQEAEFHLGAQNSAPNGPSDG